MTTFISPSTEAVATVIVDGDRDIRRRRSVRVVIIQIILLAVFVFLGSQLEELDQTKAHWHSL